MAFSPTLLHKCCWLYSFISVYPLSCFKCPKLLWVALQLYSTFTCSLSNATKHVRGMGCNVCTTTEVIMANFRHASNSEPLCCSAGFQNRILADGFIIVLMQYCLLHKLISLPTIHKRQWLEIVCSLFSWQFFFNNCNLCYITAKLQCYFRGKLGRYPPWPGKVRSDDWPGACFIKNTFVWQYCTNECFKLIFSHFR